MRFRHTLFGLVGAAALLPPCVCLAQDSGVVYAGGSVSDGINVYSGAVVALPGAALGRGLALRGGASAGRYEYISDIQLIEGKYISGEVALVYQTSGAWGWANFSAGPRVSQTDISPADPTNRLAGTRVDAALQTDGALGHRWRIDWLASGGIFDNTYNTELRFGPLLRTKSETRLGLEAGVQGDQSYTKRKVGVFLSTHVARKIQGRLAGGLSKQSDRGAQPYAAVSLSRVF